MHFTNFNYGFDKVGGLGLAAFTLVVTYYSRKKGKNWILMQTKAALCSIRKELDHFFTIIITILVVSIRESLSFFFPFFHLQLLLVMIYGLVPHTKIACFSEIYIRTPLLYESPTEFFIWCVRIELLWM